MKFIVMIISLSLFTYGCTSINSLPQSSMNVSFGLQEEGRTNWSEYKDSMFFNGVDKRTAYLAAKSGVADAGFTIKKASFNNLAIIGEHGMTAYDWNIVAGAYIKEENNGTWIKVIVEGWVLPNIGTKRDIGITI